MQTSHQPDFSEIAFTQNALAHPSVVHGFFTRRGGASTGIYASLNCGQGSDDDLNNVEANRQIVADALGADHLISLYQIHSDRCVVVDLLWGVNERPEGDSFVTDKPGIALGILTADCTPVLFTAEKEDGTSIIGAAHAGWKGAIGGVLSSTVNTMIEQGALPESIKAAIGPCIGKRSYEVDEQFMKRFLQQDDENEKFFTLSKNEGHFMFDLEGYCALRLFIAGVKQVGILGMDTYADEQNFFSYRRMTHQGETEYGRQISAIMIKA